MSHHINGEGRLTSLINQIAEKLVRDIEVRRRTAPTACSIVDAIDSMLGADGLAALTNHPSDVDEAVAALNACVDSLIDDGQAPAEIALPALFYSAVTDRPRRSNVVLKKADHILKHAPEHLPALNLKASILLDRCKFFDAWEVVNRAMAVAGQDTPAEEHILSRYGLARIHMAKQETAEALSLLQENLELALAAGVPLVAVGDVHGTIAWVHTCSQDYDRAAHHEREAISAYEADGDNYGLAHAFASLSGAQAMLGQPEQAIDSVRTAVKFAQRTGHPETIAHQLDRLTGQILHKRAFRQSLTSADLDEAEAAAKRVLGIYEDLGEPGRADLALIYLATIAEQREDWEQAIHWTQKSIAEQEAKASNMRSLCTQHQALARLLDLTEKPGEADRHYARALALLAGKDKTKSSPISYAQMLALEFGMTAGELSRRSKPERADRVYRYVLEADDVDFSANEIAPIAAHYAIFLAKQGQLERARPQAIRARGAALQCDDDALRIQVEEVLSKNGL